MHLRDPFPVLVLAGLLIEITGAFLLAADAIGVSKIQGWATRLMEVLARVSSTPFRRVLVVLWLLGMLLTTRYRVSALVQTGRADYPPIMSLSAAAIMAVYVTILAYWLMRALYRFLFFAETATERRSAGVVGFLLLFAGFVLQFIGTVGTLVLINNR